MVAETVARERRDPSTHPKVEGGTVTPSKAVDSSKTSDGADAIAPPSGGAAMRPNTNTPVVALPSGGETPAAQEVKAMREKVEFEKSESGGRMETGGSREAEHLMSVKVELELAKTAEVGRSTKTDEKGVRNVIGGDDEVTEYAVEGVMLPHETKRVGSQGLRRPDETKRQRG